MSKLICSNCGTVGSPKTITKGNIFIEIILWLCFLVPGIIYSIWRLTTRIEACASCGAENMVPLNSPMGKKLQNSNLKNNNNNVNPESRKCPYCAETINKRAKICRYCHSELMPIYVDDKKVNNQIHKIITLHNDDNTFVQIAQKLNNEGELYLKDNSEWNEQKIEYVVKNFV